MEPTNSNGIQARYNFGLLEECSDLQPGINMAKAVEVKKELPNAVGSRDDNGKKLVIRKAHILEESGDYHIRGTSSQISGESSQLNTVQDSQADKAEEKDTLDSLAKRLSDIEDQIIHLTEVQGDIPFEELMRFKLVALYIQENILIRMLHGMSSQEDAFSKMHSLGNLLPKAHNGGALKSVLDLWWLPGNEKHFPGFASSVDEEKQCPEESEIAKQNSSEDQPGGSAGAKQSFFSLTKLDKMVVIFHHLYQEFNSDKHIGLVNTANIEILETYFNLLMSEKELSFFEKEIAHFAFLQTLSHFYNRLALNCIELELGYSATKSALVKNATHDQLKYYNKILHKMTIASINSGICRVADYWILNLITSGFYLNFSGKNSDEIHLTALSWELQRSPKQESEIACAKYSCISVAEVLKDVEAFENIADNSSKYNTFALLTMLWNDLGFSCWPYSTTLNPERALEYLEFIHDEISDPKRLDSVITRDSIDTGYEFIFLMRGSTPVSQIWSERMAIYYCISHVYDRASTLLGFAKCKNKILYLGLAMASRRNYQLAIKFLERDKDLVKTVRIKAFLGVLYEKLIKQNNDQFDKHEEWWSIAQGYYQAVISSRPEINKNLARVFESRGDLKKSYEHWILYRSFLLSEAKENRLRPVRFKLSLEHRLVDEKISVLKKQLEQNKCDTDGLQEPELEKFNAGSVKKSKSKKRGIKNRRGNKKVQPETGGVAVCQEMKPSEQKKDKPSKVQAPTSRSVCEDHGESIDLKYHVAGKEQEMALGQAETPWTTVTDKKCKSIHSTAADQLNIPIGFSTEEVERHWEITRLLRNELADRILNLDLDGGDYDGALNMIDKYLENIENPVARLHFIQNKEWLLRYKSFDKRALYLQSDGFDIPIQQLKAELRLSILDCVREQVESVFMSDFQREPAQLWFSNPDLLKKDVELLRGKVHSEFFVQFGSQFSTAAHVMKDIYWEFTRLRAGGQSCQSLYGQSADYYDKLGAKFYHFRQYLDSSHESDII